MKKAVDGGSLVLWSPEYMVGGSSILFRGSSPTACRRKLMGGKRKVSKMFCPACNSELSPRDGFDADASHGVCKVCGQILINPADVRTCFRFGDVLWFCDRCEDLLNRQLGFSDRFDTWTCAKCGYENNINKDAILNMDDALERVKRLGELVEPQEEGDIPTQEEFELKKKAILGR